MTISEAQMTARNLMAFTVAIVVIGEEALAPGQPEGASRSQMRRAVIPTQASTQRGIAVRPIVTGQPANAPHKLQYRNDGEDHTGKTRIGNQI
jgi:hypothetical protein